ncbi:MAG TPA: SUF system NifU family Fe-S cluster assembly protein [Candidatus Dormibacteraeota bacterium]|nr:SUF system NifU family Fe-S cluster assembly protein [Candidatus Dormibacteraeota bacterium]
MAQVNPVGLDDELFREIILDHYRHPRHRGLVEPADVATHGHNPLCGDELDLTLRVQEGQVEAVGFEGQGCSISMAAASMMSEEIQGKTVTDTKDLITRFRAMLLEGQDPTSVGDIGDLEALAGVRRYAARIKCAMLPWSALEAGLSQLEGVDGRIDD